MDPTSSTSIPAYGRSSGADSRTTSTFDPNANPLYVHNADHAGISLVSEKLTGLGNFNTWRRSMIMALGARNKAVFVLGTYPEPDELHPDFGSWSRCNSMICTWIVNSVEKSIAKSIMYLDTARQMWLDLHDQFKQSDGPRTAEIKQQIFSEIQGSQSVSEYYTKLKQLWEELKNHESAFSCCCGKVDCVNIKKLENREEQNRVLKFLMGLNDNFTAITGPILMMEPKPSISKVFNLISQEERQRIMQTSQPNSGIAFQVSEQTVAAYNSGYNKTKNRPMCSHCGMLGHTVNRCYKLHGYPQGYKSSTPIQRIQNTSFKPQNKVQNQSNQNQTAANWLPKQERVASLSTQQSDSISLINQQGVHLGRITAEQVQQFLNVLNNNNQVIQNDYSQQNSGSTITLADGTTSKTEPQPHITTQLHSNPGIPSQSLHFISSTGIQTRLNFSATTWVIDTGASCHVCCDLNLFLETESISNTFVTLPDGTIISVTISGTV